MISSRPRQPRIASISSERWPAMRRGIGAAIGGQAARRAACRRARAPAPGRRARTSPSTARTPAGSSDRPARQRARRAGIDGQHAPRRQRCRRSSACAPSGPPATAGTRCSARLPPAPAAAASTLPMRDRHRARRPGSRCAPRPASCACRRRSSRAAARRPSPRSPASALRPPGCARAAGSRSRIGGVEAVDVGQQDQLIGLHHLGHARGEAVVVAEADFRGGDACRSR